MLPVKQDIAHSDDADLVIIHYHQILDPKSVANVNASAGVGSNVLSSFRKGSSNEPNAVSSSNSAISNSSITAIPFDAAGYSCGCNSDTGTPCRRKPDLVYEWNPNGGRMLLETYCQVSGIPYKLVPHPYNYVRSLGNLPVCVKNGVVYDFESSWLKMRTVWAPLPADEKELDDSDVAGELHALSLYTIGAYEDWYSLLLKTPGPKETDIDKKMLESTKLDSTIFAAAADSSRQVFDRLSELLSQVSAKRNEQVDANAKTKESPGVRAMWLYDLKNPTVLDVIVGTYGQLIDAIPSWAKRMQELKSENGDLIHPTMLDVKTAVRLYAELQRNIQMNPPDSTKTAKKDAPYSRSVCKKFASQARGNTPLDMLYENLFASSQAGRGGAPANEGCDDAAKEATMPRKRRKASPPEPGKVAGNTVFVLFLAATLLISYQQSRI